VGNNSAEIEIFVKDNSTKELTPDITALNINHIIWPIGVTVVFIGFATTVLFYFRRKRKSTVEESEMNLPYSCTYY
ncbi:hypothetical protein QYM36_019057, partial [Artemia franciscana]